LPGKIKVTKQLELCIKGGEQVQEAEFLGDILDGQLSWSSHIGKVVVNMGINMFGVFHTKINCTSCSGFALVQS
jgi:hypothetical protein